VAGLRVAAPDSVIADGGRGASWRSSPVNYPTHVPRRTMTAIEILRNEHAVIIEALDLLEHHVGEVGKGSPLDAEFGRWVVQFIREFADDTHHAKEEGVLFDLLARRGLSRDTGPLALMLADHRASRDLTAGMERALADGNAAAFAAAGQRLAELLRRHVLRENEILFSTAERMLTAEDDASALQAFGRVVQDREGVLVRQRHLAAIERWRSAFGAGMPPGV
jgi:hemerythrin-like domain-containing protein